MALIKNLVACFRGNTKCVIKKIFHWNSFTYHPMIRINRDVELRISQGGVINFSKGILIEARTICSVSDGGVLSLGKMVGVNCNSMIMCHEKILIGDHTIMGSNVLVYDHDHLFASTDGVMRNKYKTSPVTIGQNCWIGANCIILRGTNIGDNCIIAAGSIIKGEYPANSIVIQKRQTVTMAVKNE